MGIITGTNYVSQYSGDEIDAALTAATNAKAVDGVLEGAGDGTFSARNVDASPTMGSDALVESGGVYSAISGKQDALTFDNEPVENSVNPVKSGGIYNSVEELRGLIYDLMPRKSLPSAPIHAFADGADGIPIKAMSVQVEAVQNGTPAPDSPSPIVGWTQASVVDNGINQWDEQWEQGNINSEGQNAPSTTIGRSKNYIRVDASTSYYIKGTGIKPYFYDINKAYLSTTTSKTDTTITTPANAAYMRFTVQGTSYGNNISINLPSTDTSYHAYNGNTVTMQFGESVYGGTLDLVDGKQWTLTIDRAFVALDSDFAGTIDLATNANTQQVLFRGAVTGADTTKLTDVITNYFEGGITSTTPYRARVSQRGSLFDVAISFPVGTFTDVNDFKTNWLAGKTLQVVYFIATHRVVEIEADADTVTVYGDNVLYCDCGDSSLTYRQDIGLVIGE